VGTLPFVLINGQIKESNSFILYYLPAPAELLCLPAPKQLSYTSAPVSYLAPKTPREEENTIYTLPAVFYTEPPIPSVIYLPGKIQERIPAIPPPGANLVLVKVITVLLVLLTCITYSQFDYSAITSLISDISPVENKNVLPYPENDILETEIECYLDSDPEYNKIDEETPHDLNKLMSEGYNWNKYKYVLIALGLIGSYLAF